MKKKIVAASLCAAMMATTLTGCGGGSGGSACGTSNPDVINLWAFTDEVPTMINKYVEEHPDFPYEVKATIIGTTDGAYQPALDQALAGGGKDAPDIYCVEAAFALKYTQGDASQYAMPYDGL